MTATTTTATTMAAHFVVKRIATKEKENAAHLTNHF